MFKKKLMALAAAAILLMTAQAALAENGNKGLVLESVNEVDVVVENEKGEKEVKRVDATKARILPGDEVFFSVRFKNTGTKPAADIVITNPVPGHMILKPSTMHGENASVTLSIDSGKSFDRKEALFVVEEDGTKRPPKPEEYTHVRWSFSKEIMPGEQGSVGFSAIVE